MDNIPAFPSNIANDPLNLRLGIHTGMTLRDYFAGQAIQGMLSNTKITDIIARLDKDNSMLTGISAELAYEYADAMLKARQEGNL